MRRLLTAARTFFEQERLRPDLSRTARTTVAFMVPFLAGLHWQAAVAASFAAMAAQNVAMVDIRGSYALRLALLLTMSLGLAGATCLGGLTADHLGGGLLAVLAIILLGGVWRHVSPDYGPTLATASGVLLFISLGQPGGTVSARVLFWATLAGGLWGVLVQIALWPFRAQHPLRRTVSESWIALADLFAALAPDAAASPAARPKLIAEREAALRTILDQTSATLTAAHAGRRRPHLVELEELNLAAARIATRLVAFKTSLEDLLERPETAALASSFGPVLTSLTNTARSVAITIVSRQPAHLATCEVRLRRLGNLLLALQDRVRAQTGGDAAGHQLNTFLHQLATIVGGLGRTLRATVDRADERAAFSLELRDLQTWTLQPLAATLSFRWPPDPALVRFIARLAVIEVFGVALFKLFGIERGYWLPLTVIVVLQPDYGSTRLRAGQRVLGTFAASLVASGLLWLPLPPEVIYVAIAATMAGFTYWLKRNYGVAVFFITLFVVLLTESASAITLGFTLERLGATLAGGLLALLAAQLFWPVWERQLLPGILARALRANRDYGRALLERLRTGGRYEGTLVQAKRAAEAANSAVFSSLQRMIGDPKNQQAGLETAAALANGNQRITRALTVVVLQLRQGITLSSSELDRFDARVSETLETLAGAIETEQPDADRFARLRKQLDLVALPVPATGPAAALSHSVSTQFGRCATELSAMLLAAAPPAAEPIASGRRGP